jgi:hypothetical protein
VPDQEAIREAKMLLAGRIAAEAELEGLELTDVERKMLYCSETGWTLDDMAEVKEAFERDYDKKEYEKKVLFLIKCFVARARTQDKEEYDAWMRAVHRLHGEKYFIKPLVAKVKPARDTVRLLVIALVILAVMLIAMRLANLRY